MGLDNSLLSYSTSKKSITPRVDEKSVFSETIPPLGLKGD